MKELDEHCVKILLVLFDKQQAHFNELCRVFVGKRVKFSKPTLSTHLKHLIEAGYVTRTPEKGQLVTYSLNPEKIGKTREYNEQIKRILKSDRENKKWFFSLTEKEQVSNVLTFLNLRKLNEIKALIEYGLDPESFEKWFAVKLWSNRWLERVNIWMIKKCVEDEAYRKKILEIIDDVLGDLKNAV